MSGKLYVVGTPIGNLGDFSPRAIETLEKADFLAVEDTRVTVKLLNRFDIKKEILDSKIGQFASCLVEKIVDGVAYGHTEQYLNAGFDAENVKVGDIVDVKIDSHCDDVMYCSKI